jgi:hypothetical protein
MATLFMLMASMGAKSFDYDIHFSLDVSAVTDMSEMFRGASSFQSGPIHLGTSSTSFQQHVDGGTRSAHSCAGICRVLTRHQFLQLIVYVASTTKQRICGSSVKRQVSLHLSAPSQ